MKNIINFFIIMLFVHQLLADISLKINMNSPAAFLQPPRINEEEHFSKLTKNSDSIQEFIEIFDPNQIPFKSKAKSNSNVKTKNTNSRVLPKTSYSNYQSQFPQNDVIEITNNQLGYNESKPVSDYFPPSVFVPSKPDVFQDTPVDFYLPSQKPTIQQDFTQNFEPIKGGYNYPSPQNDEPINSGYNYPRPQNDEPINGGYRYPRPQNDEPINSGYNYPKLQNDEPINSGYNYPRPQNDEPINNGYNYPRPQNDEPVNEGYRYPRPQNDEPVNSGYNYPRPQNDEPINSGYNYPRPQNDEPIKSGYNYPRPQNDEPINGGYRYPRPQNDEPVNGGYNYPRPQNDEPLNSGYNYPRPQNDEPIDTGYNYPKPQKPVIQQDFPINSYLPPQKTPIIQQDTPIDSYLPPQRPVIQQDTPVDAYLPPTKPVILQDIPVDSYLPVQKPVIQQDFPINSYLPPSQKPIIQQDTPIDSYLPPQNPVIQQDFPFNNYLPPQKPVIQQDIPVDSYLPPQKPVIQQDFPIDTYLPPTQKPIIQQDIPASSYLPIQKPVIQQDTPVDSYLPAQKPDIFQDTPVYGPPTTKKPVIFNDEPVNSYGVPIKQQSPVNSYLPPQSDTLFVEMKQPSYGYRRGTRQNWLTKTAKFNSLQMEIQNMSCLKTQNQHYFKATLKMSKSLENSPVIASARGIDPNCISNLDNARSSFEINLSGLDKMKKCGIQECSQDGKVNFCLNLRFPTISGIKLPEDMLMTLQCRTREKMFSQVKHFTVGPQEIQEKSLGKHVVFGGLQNDINSNIVLLRKNPTKNEFSTVVPFGSTVQLGEELLIKASVNRNDGWKFTRLADVIMHKVGSDPKNPHLVRILDQKGCRQDRMQTISPFQQFQDPQNPLVSTLFFRAFAFQDMNNGDQMMLSVKLLGCIEYNDCFKDWPCQPANVIRQAGTVRSKRNLEMPKNKTIDLHTNISFKVMIADQVPYYKSNEVNVKFTKLYWLPFILLLFVFCLILIMFCFKYFSFGDKTRF